MAHDAEWRHVLLEELAAPTRNALVGGPFGSDLVQSDYSPNGVPVIRGENVSVGRWVGGDFVFVPPSKAAKLAANTAGALDIVFTQRGANHYRQVAIVPADTKGRFVISQSQMKLTVDLAKVDPLFTYYLFRSPTQQEYLQRNAIQTGVPHTNLSILRKVPLRIPSLPTQRAIARILGMLDDKIELNGRTNETLDAMARTLFKSWFVDFDPVRAKAEGRDADLRKEIADLFPDRLEDSELGEIPAGWTVSKIGDKVATILGGTPSRAEPRYWGGDIPWINSGKANEFRVVEPSEFITKDGLDSSATTLLPTRTTVIAITGATLGQVSLTEIATCANQSIVGVIGKAEIPSEFLYLWIRSRIHDLLASQTGGAQQHINKNNVNDVRVLVPSEAIMRAFIGQARPWFDRIKACCLESRTLATLRDTLLPKLISGELRVKDAEALDKAHP